MFFVLVAAVSILSIWYRNVEMVREGTTTVLVLAAAGSGVTLAAVLWLSRILSRREPPRNTLGRGTPRTWLVVIIVSGVVSRLAWAIAFDPPLLSDGATYFMLAEKLYAEGFYEDRRGDRAFWPPGYPFFLFTAFKLVGVHPWVVVGGNLILYVISSMATYRIGYLLLGARAGSVAVLLLAAWPNYVFLAPIASKEILLTALLPVALLLYLRAANTTAPTLRSLAQLLCSGATLGLASLTQPSMMLFPGVLAGHALLRRDRILRSVRDVGIVAVAMAIVIAPWAIRNLHVLNAFVPVSTNGGDVFYRANNPEATGGYTREGELSSRALNEVDRNRAGFRRGLDWIRANPGHFLALALMKQVLFLGDDSNGAAETLRRDRTVTAMYIVAKAVSNAYWLCIWALILLTARLRPHLYSDPALMLFALSLLYLLAIATIFESGTRHHIPLVGLLAILASGLFAGAPERRV
jgi:4-amino-4-deoxy-L-arabinose transferase-like glycosyltransferase